jgi:3-deoxy-7-phosphoheptulonate synthase
MAMAAVASGASGLIVEVHPNPDKALSDGYQSLYPEQFQELAEDCAALAELLAQRRLVANSRSSLTEGLKPGHLTSAVL